jgi:hypothetical protein
MKGVTPAKAGVQKRWKILDSRLRGNDSQEGQNLFLSITLNFTITKNRKEKKK